MRHTAAEPSAQPPDTVGNTSVTSPYHTRFPLYIHTPPCKIRHINSVYLTGRCVCVYIPGSAQLTSVGTTTAVSHSRLDGSHR